MTQTSFPKTEEQILASWQERKIFEKTLKKPSSKGDFVFYDGPPFATGLPHYGHIIAGTIKDVIPRYKTMQGFRVQRRWGWDCHGLPIENLIEKEKGFETKKDIEEDIEGFNSACRKSVLRYRDEWKKSVARTGRWVDMERDYKTMDNRYIEAIWWIFKELYKDGLVYEGYKSMHLCPRCETTLSNFEVTLGYKEVKDLAVTVKFKITNYELLITNIPKGASVYMLAWTTTPWTLPGNIALAVGEDIIYSIVKIEDAYYLAAKGRLEEVLNGKEYTLIGELNGKDIVGLAYESLFQESVLQIKDDPNFKNAFKVYAADFVNTDEGTGIAHEAPAFGEDDYQLSLKEHLPFLQHVNYDGTFKDYVSFAPGKKVKSKEDPNGADVEVIKYLAEHNLLFKKEKYSHSYPHCWRCDTPLLNYASSSWFVKVTALKERLLEANEKVNWIPEHIKDGRFGKWLENARDWAISRSRYWGAPLPVWLCKNSECGEIAVVGSIAELYERTDKNNKSSENLEDLHRPYIDAVLFPCKKCGGHMQRVEYVFDCWFESGAMPYASELVFSDYKITNETTKEELRKHIAFPSDFIAEGTDQTRGWFYTLMVLGVALYNESPFKNVIVNGIILAEDGQKMSKRLKNYPDPQVIMDKYGADAMRFYLMSSPAVRADSLNFSEKGVDEVYKKVILLTLNVVNFWKMYADELRITNYKLPITNTHILDQWIMERLHQLIEAVTKALDDYEIDKACRPVVDFIDDLSTWYVRRSRERFKNEGEDKETAIATLEFVLREFSKLIAPITPFLAEHVYEAVGGGKESVHLEKWPSIEHQESSIKNQEDNLDAMRLVRKICETGHRFRALSNVKVRQPLGIIEFEYVVPPTLTGVWGGKDSEYIALIQNELNVKEVKFVQELSVGKGWVQEEDVAIYTVIDDSLQDEGILRELTRQINNLRKKRGLSIQDIVGITYETSSLKIIEIIEKFDAELKKSVLAKSIQKGSTQEGDEADINGETLKIRFVK